METYKALYFTTGSKEEGRSVLSPKYLIEIHYMDKGDFELHDNQTIYANAQDWFRCEQLRQALTSERDDIINHFISILCEAKTRKKAMNNMKHAVISETCNSKWELRIPHVLYDINYAKFSQHASARDWLLATGDAQLVFRNEDERLGSGQRSSHTDPRTGANELGKALMQVRKKLQEETDTEPRSFDKYDLYWRKQPEDRRFKIEDQQPELVDTTLVEKLHSDEVYKGEATPELEDLRFVVYPPSGSEQVVEATEQQLEEESVPQQARNAATKIESKERVEARLNRTSVALITSFAHADMT